MHRKIRIISFAIVGGLMGFLLPIAALSIFFPLEIHESGQYFFSTLIVAMSNVFLFGITSAVLGDLLAKRGGK